MAVSQKQLDAGVKKIMQTGRLTTQELAVLFGCTKQVVLDYTNKGILDPDRTASPFKYPAWDSVNKIVCHFRKTATGRAQAEDVKDLAAKKLTADIELKSTQAKKAKRELAALNGTLVKTADVEAAVTELGLLTRSLLMSLPGKVAGDIVMAKGRREAAGIIDKAIRSILAEISQFDIEAFWRCQKEQDFDEE